MWFNSRRQWILIVCCLLDSFYLENAIDGERGNDGTGG